MGLLEILAQIGVETSGLKDFALTGIAPLDSATPSQISYIDQKKYLSQLSTSSAALPTSTPSTFLMRRISSRFPTCTLPP